MLVATKARVRNYSNTKPTTLSVDKQWILLHCFLHQKKRQNVKFSLNVVILNKKS